MNASEVMSEARKVYLNDYDAKLYTDTVLIPHVAAAYDELQQELELNGTSQLKEVSSPITVLTGATTLTLPSDFVSPIELKERALGDTNEENWKTMSQREWEPTERQGTVLRWWTYREDGIKFIGATSDREIRLEYYKSLTPITSGSVAIPIVNSKRFLSLRTAELAARFIGQNMILSSNLKSMADEALNKLIGRNVRSRQGLGVKRRRYRASKRRQQFYING